MTLRPSSENYVGRRVAGRSSTDAVPVPTPPAVESAALEQGVVTEDAAVVFEVDATHVFEDTQATAALPLRPAVPGKRRAVKHAGRRGPLFKGLPSPPVLVGATVLAISVGGAVISAQQAPQLASSDDVRSYSPASALSGSAGIGRVAELAPRSTTSRDSSRQALAETADAELVAAAERQARQRNAALGELAAAAENQAAKLAENTWVLPLNPSVTTAVFGQVGLWATYHTGLDFNGETGDPIMNIATGTVTFTGYDGSYGNKTVVTLEDGTEIWYAHQTEIMVSVGDTVPAGEVIGTVGTTGNVTGSHLHVEVRPGGGDPVDPYAAFVVHGVTP
ncbi:M23 family metallopeptidase [Nocardioides nanhaiensis]|uniref:M23ase beta-sheet core domain-containing protein n=1 Tax=Nocardioides nanhaiensis TaxID=1476871 RepID=A0ABP8VYQ2_9ACTN